MTSVSIKPLPYTKTDGKGTTSLLHELCFSLDLNLLDWGSNNKIAVGLGTLVYLYNADNDHIEELYYNNTSVYPTSLKWNRHSSTLAVGTSDSQIQVSTIYAMTVLCSTINVMLMDSHSCCSLQ